MKKNKPYPLYQLHEISDLKELIDYQAQIHPQAPAFQWKTRKEKFTRTRKEFQNDIRRLVNSFAERNIENETIAIIGENSYMYLVVFFAIVISGNIAVPIDKDASKEDIVNMLRLARAGQVIYSSGYDEFVSSLPQPIQAVSIDQLSETYPKAANDHYDPITIDPDAICAYFFTSGTEGFPKAVMLSHRNMAFDINKACRNFVLEGDTVSFLPFHHCFGLITAIFKVFNYGKTTFIDSSLRRIQKTLKEEKPQTIFVVPLFLETFHKRIWTTIRKEGAEARIRRSMQRAEQLLKLDIDFRRKLFKKIIDELGGNLQYVICGGAFLDQDIIDDFHAWGISVLNGYGITECSPVVAVNRNHFIKKGSVGQVLEDVEIRISPDGEICVKGDLVMQGYFNDPQATAQVLQDGWFNTRDLGTIDSDRFLFLTGRGKNLIILSNGENVSPEQIEMVLSRHDEIAEVVVFAKNSQLCAAIYPDPDLDRPQEKIEEIVARYNEQQPAAKQIARTMLRSEPFEKNASQKIVRSKATGE